MRDATDVIRVSRFRCRGERCKKQPGRPVANRRGATTELGVKREQKGKKGRGIVKRLFSKPAAPSLHAGTHPCISAILLSRARE